MTSNKLKDKPDLKVVLVGDTSVGKTCLVLRYIDRHFQESISTIGAAFVIKTWGYYSIAIWDTAGGERYAGLSTFYYRNASAAILVFDMFDRKSFHTLTQRYIPILNNVGSAVLKVVVSTKSDLLSMQERRVSKEEGIALAKKCNPHLEDGIVPYFETSSKNGLNVDTMFEYIFQHFYPDRGSRPKGVDDRNDSVFLNDALIQKNNSSCCH